MTLGPRFAVGIDFQGLDTDIGAAILVSQYGLRWKLGLLVGPFNGIYFDLTYAIPLS